MSFFIFWKSQILCPRGKEISFHSTGKNYWNYISCSAFSPKHILNYLRKIINCYYKLFSNANGLLMIRYLLEALDLVFIYCALSMVHSLQCYISISSQPNQIIFAFPTYSLPLYKQNILHPSLLQNTATSSFCICSYSNFKFINMPQCFFQALFCFVHIVRECSVCPPTLQSCPAACIP